MKPKKKPKVIKREPLQAREAATWVDMRQQALKHPALAEVLQAHMKEDYARLLDPKRNPLPTAAEFFAGTERISQTCTPDVPPWVKKRERKFKLNRQGMAEKSRKLKHRLGIEETERPRRSRRSAAASMDLTDYPHVLEMLRAIAADNGLQLIEKPKRLPPNIVDLEARAAKLSLDERETLATGEHSEQQALVQAKDLEKLDAFLASAFDGVWHSVIYE
jgi:hypothetical protein